MTKLISKRQAEESDESARVRRKLNNPTEAKLATIGEAQAPAKLSQDIGATARKLGNLLFKAGDRVLDPFAIRDCETVAKHMAALGMQTTKTASDRKRDREIETHVQRGINADVAKALAKVTP